MSALERLAYVLKVLEAGTSVRNVHLPVGEHAVGSLPGSRVWLQHKGVSRRHATLEVLPDGGVVLTDLGSKNGTFVDGRRVGRVALGDYATVAFGPVQTVLHRVDAVLAEIAIRGENAVDAGAAGAGGAFPASTEVRGWVEGLAESLRRLVEAPGRPLDAAGAATLLAREWRQRLSLRRVEVRRLVPGGGEALVAVVGPGVGEGEGEEGTAPEIRCARGGWSAHLWGDGGMSLQRAAPLVELGLALVAAREAAPAPTPGATVSAPAGGGEAGDGKPAPGEGEVGAAADEEAALPEPGSLDPAVQALYRRAARVARGDISVLILGESGSGKEVLARWLHHRSRRRRGPFLALNCAALPRELLEAELFGIERGVATGVEARKGLLEQAAGGTVFLDEIGDMPLETQAKVLRALESTTSYRVGGRSPVPVDVRFFAATNRELEEAIEEGRFRRDLYYRLAAFVAPLPPLRRRREDVPLLAGHFLRRELRRNGLASPGMTGAALAALLAHSWPGNVRELENEIARAVLLLEAGEPLDAVHLSPRLRAGAEAGGHPLRLDGAVARAEAEAFRVALAAAGGDAARARELLGVSRATYYRKLKELGLG